MVNKKIPFRSSIIPIALSVIGCTTVKYYPTNFVESLKHPTKFPEVYSVDVKNIEDVADKSPLGENEEVKITYVSENKNSSMYLIQIRENGEMHPHYHKRHDEVLYVKKGSGIATLSGSRYLVKPGSILQIPSKTAHKFLNTGDETFVAVSIFSPPFDGRDEKKIKERRKIDRGTKGEKKIARKKIEPEKATEEDKVSKVTNDPVDDESTPSQTSSKKIAERQVDQPVHEEWDTHSAEQSPPPEPSQEGKKKPKEATFAASEDSVPDIKDMHEKLAKLFRLKEEGVLSEEEYEEKKDAIIKGNDIGGLPEPKMPLAGETPIEDDEPALEDMDEQALSRKLTTAKGKDIGENISKISPAEDDSIAHGDESGEAESAEYKLKTLDEMMQEGLITNEEYENEKKELTASQEDEKAAATPPEDTRNDEKVKELKALYDEGLITRENYESKRNELLGYGKDEEIVHPVTAGDAGNDEKIRELKELYDEGFITREDYEYKLKELTISPKPNTPDSSSLKDIQNEKLSELKELKEQGLISDEDYEFKKSQLMSR